MNKSERKDIASLLIAISGANFDGQAFSDCDDIISEAETSKIIDEIQSQCYKTITKLQNKYRVQFCGSVKSVIEGVLYET